MVKSIKANAQKMYKLKHSNVIHGFEMAYNVVRARPRIGTAIAYTVAFCLILL